MPRFVLLLHNCPSDQPRPTHCDLMLEADGALRAWALARVPRDWEQLNFDSKLLASSNTIAAERLADHRIDYLEYEGPVGGGRGFVRRIESGSYQVGPQPTHFYLEGRTIRGEIEIVPDAPDSLHCRLAYRSASSSGGVSVSPAM